MFAEDQKSSWNSSLKKKKKKNQKEQESQADRHLTELTAHVKWEHVKFPS